MPPKKSHVARKSNGHRKVASRKYMAGKLAGLCDEDAAALVEQLILGRGVSGGRAGL
jgi:hypothetical protein